MQSESPFRFINNIRMGIPLTREEISSFNPYLMARSYYYAGYEKWANLMNLLWPLEKDIQFKIFSVLFHGIYPRGWVKSAKDKNKDGAEVEFLKKKYQVSTRVAREYASLLTTADKKEIKKVWE